MSDPVADADRLAAQAAQTANLDAAARRKSRRRSSLLAAGDPNAAASLGGPSVLDYGKTTLGG